MKLIQNHPKKDFLTYKEAMAKFEDGEFPYEPFCVIEEENFPNHGKKLLIGYRKDGAAIIIQDRTIKQIQSKDEVEAYHVSRMGINTYYKKVARPRESMVSIFRKPKVGDKVMCVAKERYIGAVFGETYTVKEITHEGRIGFEIDAQYTYESKYFVVVSDKKSSVSIAKAIFSGHMHDKKSYHNDITDAMGYATMYHNSSSGRIVMGVDPAYKDVSDAIADEDALIVRKKLQPEKIKTRRVFDEALIQRSK